LRQRFGQRSGQHPSLVVGGDGRRCAEPEQPQRPVDGHVPLRADEHADLRRAREAVTADVPGDLVEHVPPRGGEAGHVRDLRARDEADRRFAGQTEQLEQPVAGDLLDHRGRRPADIEAGVLVPGGGEPVGSQCCRQRAADHEAEVAAAGRRHEAGLRSGGELVDDLLCR
jgi:hypothetical protein